MASSRIKSFVLAAFAGLTLGGCAYTGGYGGASLGYGSAGYYGSGYGDPYFGAGYYPGYAGWYNDFYWPGNGAYVYDRRGGRHAWNDDQRRYFEGRRYALRDREDRRDYRQFRRDGRQDRRAFRAERREDRQALRSGAITRDQFRADRRADRRAYRQERRVDRRAFRQDLRGGRRGSIFITPKAERRLFRRNPNVRPR